MSRKYREGRLIATVMDTVRGGGNVLMPTDTAGELPYTSDLFMRAIYSRRIRYTSVDGDALAFRLICRKVLYVKKYGLLRVL